MLIHAVFNRSWYYEYLIGVWPPKPVEGWNLFMSTALSTNQQPVTNAVVTVTGALDDQAAVVGPLAAVNNLSHLGVYELYLPLSTPGQWVFKVEIKSPLGERVVEVPLEVIPILDKARLERIGEDLKSRGKVKGE